MGAPEQGSHREAACRGAGSLRRRPSREGWRPAPGAAGQWVRAGDADQQFSHPGGPGPPVPGPRGQAGLLPSMLKCLWGSVLSCAWGLAGLPGTGHEARRDGPQCPHSLPHVDGSAQCFRTQHVGSVQRPDSVGLCLQKSGDAWFGKPPPGLRTKDSGMTGEEGPRAAVFHRRDPRPASLRLNQPNRRLNPGMLAVSQKGQCLGLSVKECGSQPSGSFCHPAGNLCPLIPE